MIKPDAKKRAAFVRFCTVAIVIFALVFMAYLLPSSLFRTTAVSTGEGRGEVVIFNYDNFFLNLIALFISVGAIYLIYKFVDSVSLKACYVALMLWVLLFGVVFVASAKLQPSEDSYILTFFARQAAFGDYSYYHDYFRLFPYQFGFVLYEELFFKLFYTLLPEAPTGFSSMALQGMNVLFLLAGYHSIMASVARLNENEGAVKLTALLLFLCLPPLFTCTYMYGNIPALALGCAACWQFIVFQQEGRLSSALWCLVFVAVAVCLKLNSLIFFAALLILWVLSLVEKPKLSSLLLMCLMVFAVLWAKGLPQRYYELRCQEDFGDGVPLVGWLAMGLSEGQSCSGWYDTDYTTSPFIDSGYDGEATSAIAREAIGERLGWFASQPLEGLRFFGRKFLSQWNEPSYQSLWTNQVREHYSEPIFVHELLCHRLERVVLTVMKLYQQLLFFSFTLGLIDMLRRRSLCHTLFPLIILGGMLYHLLFEAKSQFILSYFVLMVPVAAYGLYRLFEYLKDPSSCRSKARE